MRRFAVAALLVAGCGSDLPQSSFIDKLRVLAVQADPPEVAPGQPTRLRRLAVEPEVLQAQDDAGPVGALQTLWLACAQGPGVTTPVPCGVGPDATAQIPPRCADAPNAPLCLIGEDDEAVYTPGDATGQVLLTAVVADTIDGARGCLIDIALHDGVPTMPDRCVIALKRLVVSDKPAEMRNRNPALNFFALRDKAGTVQSLTDGSAGFAAAANAPGMTLAARRTDDSAELGSDGKYEALTVSWFTSGGKIDGGRSALEPAGCTSQLDCADKPPSFDATTNWTPPAPDALAATNPDGTVRYWAVIRDDRGGVDWLEGTARAR
jgi:hypothetical protein